MTVGRLQFPALAAHWRWPVGLALLALGGWLLFQIPFAPTNAADVYELNQALFLASERDDPPPADDPGWEQRRLPDLWSRRMWLGEHLQDKPAPTKDAIWPAGNLPDLWTNRMWMGSSGWYRFQLDLSSPPDKLQGLYLFRVNMNAAAWFNGEYLGAGGSMQEPLTVNWNHPLYFRLPHKLWRPAGNELLIHLRAYPGFGAMGPVQIGSDQLLTPRWRWRIFLQNDLPQTFAILLTVVGLYTLGLWLRRRRDTLYLWFALSSFCWAIFNLRLFVVDQPIPEATMRWLAHSAIDFWMVFLVTFMHRFLGMRRPRLEWGLAALQTLFMVMHGAPPAPYGYWVSHYSHALTLLMAGYLTVLCWRQWHRHRQRQVLAAALAFSATVLAGLHDMVMQNTMPGLFSRTFLEGLWRQQMHLLYLTVPAVILMLAWHLTGRFMRALDDSERLNLELEQRVAEVHTALAQSFEERRKLERDQAAADERERIYRDMHDDIGAKLLSLAIGAENPQRADTARSALQDLRDVVSRSGRGPQPLSFLLADCRAEMEARLKSAGLKLEWRQAYDLPDPRILPAAALHLGRILREAVTNVLRHAQASHLDVTLQYQDEALCICLADDGLGLPGEELIPGKGLVNMTSRTRQLAGEIHWHPVTPHGCEVRLRLPTHALLAEAEAPYRDHGKDAPAGSPTMTTSPTGGTPS